MKQKLVYLFSGQGSHYYQMGLPLMNNEPIFRDWMEKLDDEVKVISGASVLDVVYASDKKRSDRFDELKVTHPAIFMIQFAMAKTLEAYGIRPDVVLGTSLGEYVAAAYAEVFDYRDALLCLIQQADMVTRKCERGGMVSILDDPQRNYDDPESFGNCELVSVNFDGHYTLSGSQDDIRRVVAHLDQKGILHQVLMLTEGFHSSMIDPIADDYRHLLSQFPYQKPVYSLISCVTGNPIMDSFEAEHFWRIFREPIKFREAVQYLIGTQEEYCCVDLSPSATMATFIKYMSRSPMIETVPTITPFGQDLKNLNRVLKRLEAEEFAL